VRPAKRVFFPLDKQLIIHDKHWSEGVARQAVKLSGKMVYADAAETLQETGQIRISPTSVWRLTQTWGVALQAQETQEVQPEPRERPAERLSASLDGAMVYIREEGWKEFKAGTISEVTEELVLNPQTLEEEPQARARHTSYVAALGGPETIGGLLWQEAVRRGWQQAFDTEVVADTAAWIWNLATDYFYDSVQIVDWYHAVEHLSTAAEHAYPDALPTRHRWLKEHKTTLFQGEAEQIGKDLQQLAATAPAADQETLQQEAAYFDKHKHRMQYLEWRNDGWLIGSGTVESAAKQYKHRFTAAGMRWKRDGLLCLIPVRSAVLSGTFSAHWRSAYYAPRN
jgi:hypothetical protein